MDPHRFFGRPNSAYFYPPLNRPDPYYPPPELDDRVYRVRHDSYYLPPLPNRVIDLPLPRRRIPLPYVEPAERIYRTVRHSSPPPSPPPVRHHHKSKHKSHKSKKRSHSKGIRNSDYDDDSPYEYKSKTRDKDIFSGYKKLSDDHDSISDGDFGSPISENDPQESSEFVSADIHDGRDSAVEDSRPEEKPSDSSSQEISNLGYVSYKLIYDPFLKPGGSVKIKRFDGVVPNSGSHSVIQVRDPRLPPTKLWSRLEPLDLPVPQFKVRISGS